MNTINTMNKQKNFDDYRDMFRRRKWYFVVPALSLFIIISVISVLLTATYQSSAIILIEQQDIPTEMVKSTITSFADERIQVISQRVMTSINLTSVMKKYNLYVEKSKKDTREEVLNDMRENINLDMISANVIDPRSGQPTSATIAFKLSFDSPSPGLAQKVTNELVSLYLNENLKSRTKKAKQASDFLSDESDRLRNQISGFETKLAEFKEKNAGSLPELSSLNLQMLERTDRELLEVDRQVRTLEERKVYLESQLAQLTPNAMLYSETGERILTPQGRLKGLETRYLTEIATYGPNHPDIIKMRREINALKQNVATPNNSFEDIRKNIEGLTGELVILSKQYSENHPDIKNLQRKIANLQFVLSSNPESKKVVPFKADNPAYVELQARLDATYGDIRSYGINRTKLKNKLVDIESRIMRTPQVEREYLSLARDHKTAVAKYQEIITKLMSAKLSEELEKDSKGERFSLLEPPLFPEKPIKPNRMAIVILGFFVSLGLGFGVTFLQELMDKTVRSLNDITVVVGFPPLAIIPYIITDEEITRNKRHTLVFLGSSVAILALSFSLTHMLYKPLDVLWFVIMRKMGI